MIGKSILKGLQVKLNREWVIERYNGAHFDSPEIGYVFDVETIDYDREEVTVRTPSTIEIAFEGIDEIWLSEVGPTPIVISGDIDIFSLNLEHGKIIPLKDLYVSYGGMSYDAQSWCDKKDGD